VEGTDETDEERMIDSEVAKEIRNKTMKDHLLEESSAGSKMVGIGLVEYGTTSLAVASEWLALEKTGIVRQLHYMVEGPPKNVRGEQDEGEKKGLLVGRQGK